MTAPTPPQPHLRAVPPRPRRQVTSFKVFPQLLAEFRDLAAANGFTVSKLICGLLQLALDHPDLLLSIPSPNPHAPLPAALRIPDQLPASQLSRAQVEQEMARRRQRFAPAPEPTAPDDDTPAGLPTA